MQQMSLDFDRVEVSAPTRPVASMSDAAPDPTTPLLPDTLPNANAGASQIAGYRAAEDSNILKALLGQRFFCHVCARVHPPASSKIRQCASRLTERNISRNEMSSWYQDLSAYHNKKGWLKANARWTDEQQARFDSITLAIERLSFSPDPPAPVPSELAASDGAARYRQRYDAWFRANIHEHARRAQRALPLLAELNALLPPPYPVGLPTGSRSSGGTLIPDPPFAREITRVCDLFPRPPCHTVSGQELHLAFTRFGSAPRTRRVWTPAASALPSARVRLNTIFSSDVRGWVRSASSTRLYFDPNDFGLDPAFWATVVLYRGTLTLRTHSFTLRQAREDAHAL